LKYIPLITTLLKVNSYHRLKVFIWPDIETLQKATKAPGAEGKWERPTLRVWNGDDGTTEIKSRIVGRIHLYIDGFGAGIVAHELEHFIQDWIELEGIETDDPESVPTLAGSLTNQFWNWFYEHFEENVNEQANSTS
jgi:hypothetical protein